MDSDSDSYFEESSSEDEQEVAGPLHVNVEINLEEPPEAPEVDPPAPIPEQEPVPGWELPDDGNNFLNYYTRTDVIELRNWAHETRNRINELGYVIEAPMIPENFALYLLEHHGPQWEANFLQLAAEPLFQQMLAYIAGYARLTSFNKHQLRSFYETWAEEERTTNLCMLAESGGFLEIE